MPSPQAGSSRASVVIVGSGFAGFTCARRLTRRARAITGTRIDVTMVSPVDYLLYTPLLADVAGGLVDTRTVTVPLAGMVAGVRTVRGHVDAVDFANRTVRYTGMDRKSGELRWDRLVLAPGSVTRLLDIPGLATHARGFKSVAEALYLRDHVLEQLELATLEKDPDAARARRTIVVVGASAIGTPLAATLRGVADAAATQLQFDPAEVRILLLDLADQVLAGWPQKLITEATTVLTQHRIDVRMATSLQEVGADHVVLTDGTTVGTHTVVWVTGGTAAPLIKTLGLPTDKDRITVGADLMVPDHPDVFAAGDAAAVPDLKRPGSTAQPTAQCATRQAKVMADNVLASLRYGTKRLYKHKDLGMVTDLGRGRVVANVLNVRLTGRLAKLATISQRVYSLPRNGNRIQAAFAATIGSAFPRILVSLGLATMGDAEFSSSEGIPLPRGR